MGEMILFLIMAALVMSAALIIAFLPELVRVLFKLIYAFCKKAYELGKCSANP